MMTSHLNLALLSYTFAWYFAIELLEMANRPLRHEVRVDVVDVQELLKNPFAFRSVLYSLRQSVSFRIQDKFLHHPKVTVQSHT